LLSNGLSESPPRSFSQRAAYSATIVHRASASLLQNRKWLEIPEASNMESGPRLMRENQMASSRRAFVKGTAATAAVVCAPGLIKAQSAPTRARTLRAVLHGDLQVFDPIWTTANMTGNHSLLIYDTLFGMDENRKPQPQMIDKWDL